MMDKNMMRMRFLCLSLAAVFFFCVSCSQSEPEIKYGSLELVYYENGGNPVERFSFFVLPSDGDGIEDLEELRLYHDWEGLSWRLTSDDWIRQSVNGQIWIGSRAIAMEDGSSLPRGQYRAVLTDKGGEKAEKLLAFDASETRPFPAFSITGGRYWIESAYPRQDLVVYDDEGSYLISVDPPSPEGEISALGLPSQARSVALWARDPEQSVSAFTDVVPLND
ncbi:MAG: hypothetical protein LBG26_07605 [Treponema sp.]|jgi:hypothetical protein|nr:hypothetical protein [Treponema sp.]